MVVYSSSSELETLHHSRRTAEHHRGNDKRSAFARVAHFRRPAGKHGGDREDRLREEAISPRSQRDLSDQHYRRNAEKSGVSLRFERAACPRVTQNLWLQVQEEREENIHIPDRHADASRRVGHVLDRVRDQT